MAIESSAPEASVALGCDGRLVFARSVTAGRRPSEVLMEPVRAALEVVPEGQRLAGVVMGTGPGSYNGARVGIATGQGVALAHGCAAAGVCSLEAVEVVRRGGRCLAIGDARRESFFAVPLEHGLLTGRTELLEHAVFVDRVREAVADGISLFSFEEMERLRLPEDLAAQAEVVVPDARLVLEAWLARSARARDELARVPPQPFYLREPYVT